MKPEYLRFSPYQRFKSIILITIFCIPLANQAWGTGMARLFEGMTVEDINLMKQRARIDMKDKPVGTKLEWENEAKKHSGTVTLLARGKKDGRECRKLQHDMVLDYGLKHRYFMTICLLADGSWQWQQPKYKKKK